MLEVSLVSNWCAILRFRFIKPTTGFLISEISLGTKKWINKNPVIIKLRIVVLKVLLYSFSTRTLIKMCFF
jgi:hypothetical protein